MHVKLARTAGFCMGVRRAMEIAQDAASESSTEVYTHGPLIHNAQAVEVLQKQGVRSLDSFDELEGGRVVIRAHGIPKEEKENLAGRGFELIDATCPHVTASQKRIEKQSAAGLEIVLVGDRDHAEVVGLAGHSSTTVHIISSAKEAESLQLPRPFCVIAQTTFNAEEYAHITRIFEQRYPGCKVFDSICRATSDRQQEALSLSREVDAMVVVGGKHSANTCRLAEIAREAGKPTFHVETADELDTEELALFEVIGVTAGASTPGWLTQTVLDRIESIGSGGITGFLEKIYSLSVKSYIFTAVGAVAFFYSLAHVAGITSVPWNCAVIVFSYIFSIYNFNRLAASWQADNPGIAVWKGISRYSKILFMASLILTVISFYLSVNISHGVVYILAASYLGGVIYSLPLLPRSMRKRRLKDIPASKDIFVAAAWATLIAGMCADLFSPLSYTVAGLAGVVFLLVFAKTVSLDLRDTEGDRLIGTETIPVLIGKKRSIVLLRSIYLLAFLLIALLSWFGIFMQCGYALCAVAVYGYLSLRIFRKKLLSEEVRCQTIIDGQFILAWVFVKIFNLVNGAF